MQTAVLLAVPEAEPLVAAWRTTGDPAAALGIPAHVTLLYPFLPPDRVDAGTVAELERFFRGVDAFDVRFDRIEEVAESGVVYLDPVGKELDELASALARRWPDTPPYGGAVDHPHAHLTVVHHQSAALRAAAGVDVRTHLPLVARAATASLCKCREDGRWRQRDVFPLADGSIGTA